MTGKTAKLATRAFLGSTPVAVGLYAVVMGAIIYAAVSGAEAMGYNWQWYRIPRYFYSLTDEGFQLGEIVYGLGATLVLSAAAFLLALVFGLILALLRLSDLVVGPAVARIILEFVRNMPLLVLLYVFYYVLGPIFGLDRYVASILCLALFHGCLISEIIRAGILSVDDGQWEAASSLGLRRSQSYRLVVLPQAVPLMLPPLTGEAVSLIKSSAIVSVIAVAELTTIGRNIISDTYMSFEIWFTIAAVYLVVTLCLSIFVSYLERRVAV